MENNVTSHLITVKDEWGTPVNPHPYNKWMRPGDFSYMQHNDFALSNPPLPAPEIKDTIEPVMAEVAYQMRTNNDLVLAGIDKEVKWQTVAQPIFIKCSPQMYRQIYILSPEVKIGGEPAYYGTADAPRMFEEKSVDKGIGETRMPKFAMIGVGKRPGKPILRDDELSKMIKWFINDKFNEHNPLEKTLTDFYNWVNADVE